MRNELAPKIEAKLPILTSDLGNMIVNAICTEDIPKVIHNSFRHVGIWPLDRSVIERMVKDEKACHSSLSHEIQEAIPMVIELVMKIDEICQISAQEKGKDERNKKKAMSYL